MAKQLIYTADDGFADSLIRSLRSKGHFCKVVEDEETDLREVRGQGYSLILLDDAPALPSVNDLRNGSAMPILLLVEPARLLSQPTPIEADDAIVKPVREEELIFRVKTCEHGPVFRPTKRGISRAMLRAWPSTKTATSFASTAFPSA